jgi:hypothetical protein
MLASSVITVASLPVYSALYGQFGAVGLVGASDLGIAANCLAMAVLLHKRELVSVHGLKWREIGKAFAIAVVAGVAGAEIARAIPLHGSRAADIKLLVFIGAVWLAIVALGLWLTKSELPEDLRRRSQASGPVLGMAPETRMNP